MPGRAARPLRTLVVDSSEAVHAGVARWAAGRPELIIVGTARTGPDALLAVGRLEVDLVLIDAVLPGLDGLHVVRAIKAHADPPLAVVTSLFADSAMRQEAFAAGADGFVPKDDFAVAFERLLPELADSLRRGAAALRTPERSDRRGSRIEPDP
jgi:DNA-binding NarL/FixJ family response regulator